MCQAIDQTNDHPPRLDVVFPSDERSFVQLRGELDLLTAPRLEQLLDQLRCEGLRQVILDLSGLKFLSAAGLSVFLRAHQALCATGGRLVLTQPTRIARRALEITGLDAILSIQSVQQDWVSMVEHVDPGGEPKPPKMSTTLRWGGPDGVGLVPWKASSCLGVDG